MRFAAASFQPGFGRVLSIAMLVIGLGGVAGFVVTGDWEGLARYSWPLLLLVAATFAMFWFPRVDVSEGEVTVRNVFSTVHVPWPAIDRVDTKYALTLYTPGRKVTAWASPAPSRYAGNTGRTRDVKLAATGSGGAIRPGDLLSTPSGAAAFLIRRNWDDLRDAGVIDAAGEDQRRVTHEIHWVTIVVLAGLALATVLGALL